MMFCKGVEEKIMSKGKSKTEILDFKDARCAVPNKMVFICSFLLALCLFKLSTRASESLESNKYDSRAVVLCTRD